MTEPKPTVAEREHMRAARQMHRRPDGVVTIRTEVGRHRNADKRVLKRLFERDWLSEPASGMFMLTVRGEAALTRCER